jgi:hypothetical protein
MAIASSSTATGPSSITHVKQRIAVDSQNELYVAGLSSWSSSGSRTIHHVRLNERQVDDRVLDVVIEHVLYGGAPDSLHA